MGTDEKGLDFELGRVLRRPFFGIAAAGWGLSLKLISVWLVGLRPGLDI